MKSRSARGVVALAVVLAGCTSSVTASTTTTEFKGVPEPWLATCAHVTAIGEAWQPIDDYLDERPRKTTTGFALKRALPDESRQLIETLVRASVEGAALAAEGDSWAYVLRLYADDVLRWFPDTLGSAGAQIGPNDRFNYDYARYGVLKERCRELLGDGADSNQGTPVPSSS